MSGGKNEKVMEAVDSLEEVARGCWMVYDLEIAAPSEMMYVCPCLCPCSTVTTTIYQTGPCLITFQLSPQFPQPLLLWWV